MISITLRRAVLLAVVAFAVRVRLDWRFRRSVALQVIDTSLGKYAVLWLSRLLLGYVIPPVLVQFWYVWPSHHAQDGRPYFDHLKYVRRTRYGPLAREELDELLLLEDQEYHPERVAPAPPTTIGGLVVQMLSEIAHFVRLGGGHHPHALPVKVGRVKKAPAVLFGHGGGWVCQGTDVQLGQLPAIARCAQVHVYSFNYPLAPEDPFPVAVISTLRALSYLKTHEGYDKVALLGESAGGNLITMAAAFVCNPPLLKRLAEETKTSVDQWSYPEVPCVVSWYSILDDKAWRVGGNLIEKDEWLNPGLSVVWDMYVKPGAPLGGKATICQLEPEIVRYPPTLLVVGSYDPLGLKHSSIAAHEMLSKRKGLQCELKIFDATHGFVGYPPQMQAAINDGNPAHWLQNCAEATKATVDFLVTHGNGRRESEDNPVLV